VESQDPQTTAAPRLARWLWHTLTAAVVLALTAAAAIRGAHDCLAMAVGLLVYTDPTGGPPISSSFTLLHRGRVGGDEEHDSPEA
jgi:hypothetical protein